MRAPLFSALLASWLAGGLAYAADADPAAGAAAAPANATPSDAAAPTAPSPADTGAGAPATAKRPVIKVFPKLQQPSLEHLYQLGLSVLPGVGFRVIAPYGSGGIDCGQQAKPVCTGLLPFFIDAQPSFGFARHWDVLVDLRFGIGVDFTHSREFALAPGVRYWVDPELPTKFFATIQGVYDATAQNNDKVRSNDFGVRNANGFMFEVMSNLGFYLQFGETIGFVRWMRFEIDGGVGVQARIP
jgi:hypothetical protein